MPNRIIKESICTSADIDGLSNAAELLFYRLIVNADDYGLFDGRMMIIASKCYPLKSIDINVLQAAFNELIKSGMVIAYTVDSKPYGKLKNWSKHQQIRAQRAKFPQPESSSAIICNQLISDVPGIQSNPIQSESNPNPNLKREAENSAFAPPTPKPAKTSAIEKPERVAQQVWDDWLTLRKAKKAPATQTVLNSAICEADKAGMTLNDFLSVWCARGSQGLEASWLKPDERSQGKPSRQAETFAERDERQAADRIAAICPSIAAKPTNRNRDVIDITPRKFGVIQ